MKLPVSPPVLPMLAKRVGDLPEGDSWIFEPKWDGFRTLIFRDGEEILIQSRDEKSLNRYFPELIETLLAQLLRCLDYSLPVRIVSKSTIHISLGDRRRDSSEANGIVMSEDSGLQFSTSRPAVLHKQVFGLARIIIMEMMIRSPKVLSLTFKITPE